MATKTDSKEGSRSRSGGQDSAFGWGSGKVDVDLFQLIGLLCLAIHLVYPVYPWRRTA